MKLPLLASIALTVVSLCQPAASAILVQTYDLNQSNKLPDGTVFGTVTLSLNPTNGTVTVTYSVNFSKIPNPLSNFGFQQVALNTDLQFGNGEGDDGEGDDGEGSGHGDGSDQGEGSGKHSGDENGQFSAPQLSANNDWNVSFGFQKLDGFGQFNIVASGTGDNRQTTETITISGLTGSEVSFSHFTIGSLDSNGQNPANGSVFFAAKLQGIPGTDFIGGNTLETLDVAEPDPFLLIGGSLGLLGMAGLRRRKQTQV